MNFVVPGDGHGRIHYRDALVDVEGIFPSRFDVAGASAPFGSGPGSDRKTGGSGETRVLPDHDTRLISERGARLKLSAPSGVIRTISSTLKPATLTG